jgi:hypothetical protein
LATAASAFTATSAFAAALTVTFTAAASGLCGIEGTVTFLGALVEACLALGGEAILDAATAISVLATEGHGCIAALGQKEGMGSEEEGCGDEGFG